MGSPVVPLKLPPPAADDGYSARRPIHRGDCLPGQRNEVRPCPFTCWHRLDLGEDGPGHEAMARLATTLGMVTNCALDVADAVAARATPISHDLIGAIDGCSGDTIRRAEARLIVKLRSAVG